MFGTLSECTWSLSTTLSILQKHSLTLCSCSPGTPGTGSCPLTKRGCAAAQWGMCNMTEICSRTPVHTRHRGNHGRMLRNSGALLDQVEVICRYCLFHSKRGFLRFPELCVLVKVVSGTCWMRPMRFSRQIWDLCIHTGCNRSDSNPSTFLHPVTGGGSSENTHWVSKKKRKEKGWTPYKVIKMGGSLNP